MKFLDFLIRELTNGNTHVRYQALLGVERLITGTDNSVDVKSLLESSQLIHPIICRVIIISVVLMKFAIYIDFELILLVPDQLLIYTFSMLADSGLIGLYTFSRQRGCLFKYICIW